VSSKAKNILWIEQDDWDATVAVNLTAVYAMVRAVLPGMLNRGSGTIVTISSLAAERPNLLGGAPYGAAKAAVRNLMGYVRNTFRAQGIRAVTILPGEMDTPILKDRPNPPSAETRAKMVAPGDVADVVLLCCSLPPRTMIEEIVVAPTQLRDQSQDIEQSRTMGMPAKSA
jgi:NADP-dependent 3-hydroxy acid dehydrogenase YdfG